MEMKQGLLDQRQRSVLPELFGDYPYVIAAYQFGSTVRGKAGPLSDLDIALLLDEVAPSGVVLARVEGLLSYRIQRVLDTQGREIDLISLNGRSISFQHTVICTGRVIYDAYPEARHRYERKITQAYLDFEPTLRWIRQFQKKGWLRRCGLQ